MEKSPNYNKPQIVTVQWTVCEIKPLVAIACIELSFFIGPFNDQTLSIHPSHGE